ncbi:hypothetical protein DV738_g4579, partial [Chaetothyriales sp. CBS 135597]
MAEEKKKKVTIIGIYGVAGAGKSHVLRELKGILGSDHFAFFEGSEVIDRLVPGGLETFKQLPEREKVSFREHAISSIAADCINDGKVGVVAGHYLFWSEDDAVTVVCTERDLATYTHIIYLNTQDGEVAARRRNDTSKARPPLTPKQLGLWQDREREELRKACYQNDILFAVIDSHSIRMTDVSNLVQHFREYTEIKNLGDACRMLDRIVESQSQGSRLKAMLVLDGDKTMAAEDTGTLFWEHVKPYLPETEDEGNPFKTLFSSRLGYSHKAFCQATLLFEEWADSERFESICSGIAAQVTLYPEIESLLQQAKADQQVGAVVITCGARMVWEKILENAHLADKVKVIGGGRISDGIVVDPVVKAHLVDQMQIRYLLSVTALGDSILDLPMLSQADKAIVVVGNEQSRSKSMDEALAHRIKNRGLRAYQTLLGSNATPRLDYRRLPLVHLSDPLFVDFIFSRRRIWYDNVPIILTDTKAAKLLMTPMRDAMNSGPSLRDAHHKTGWYLAMNALVDAIGVEEMQIEHVQGGMSSGHRLAREEDTLIVALMRGGEPMALGVNDAFPLASFLHARETEDIKVEHLNRKATVILVDSVINTGKTAIQFIRYVHSLAPYARIMVVAGVVQAEALDELEAIQKDVRHQLVALRKSNNRYTGQGGTDTGNRLFNTTYLE